MCHNSAYELFSCSFWESSSELELRDLRDCLCFTYLPNPYSEPLVLVEVTINHPIETIFDTTDEINVALFVLLWHNNRCMLLHNRVVNERFWILLSSSIVDLWIHSLVVLEEKNSQSISILGLIGLASLVWPQCFAKHSGQLLRANEKMALPNHHVVSIDEFIDLSNVSIYWRFGTNTFHKWRQASFTRVPRTQDLLESKICYHWIATKLLLTMASLVSLEKCTENLIRYIFTSSFKCGLKRLAYSDIRRTKN